MQPEWIPVICEKRFASDGIPKSLFTQHANMWCMLCVISKGVRNNTSSDVMSAPFENTVSNNIHNDVVPTSAHDSVGWFLRHEVRSQRYRLLISWLLLVAVACSCAWFSADPDFHNDSGCAGPPRLLKSPTLSASERVLCASGPRTTTVKLMVYNYWQCLVVALLRLLHINF
jgi:hypothetical protein